MLLFAMVTAIRLFFNSWLLAASAALASCYNYRYEEIKFYEDSLYLLLKFNKSKAFHLITLIPCQPHPLEAAILYIISTLQCLQRKMPHSLEYLFKVGLSGKLAQTSDIKFFLICILVGSCLPPFWVGYVYI